MNPVAAPAALGTNPEWLIALIRLQKKEVDKRQVGMQTSSSSSSSGRPKAAHQQEREACARKGAITKNSKVCYSSAKVQVVMLEWQSLM